MEIPTFPQTTKVEVRRATIDTHRLRDVSMAAMEVSKPLSP